MEEPYIEGVATCDGPESCVGFREGVGEALTGVCIGWDIEPRNPMDRRRSIAAVVRPKYVLPEQFRT